MFGVPVMSFRFRIRVWYLGLGFKFGIPVSESSFGMQSLGYRFGIRDKDLGL